MRARHATAVCGVVLAFSIAAASFCRNRAAFLQMQHRQHLAIHVLLFLSLAVLLTSGLRSTPVRLAAFLGMLLLGYGSEWCEHLHDGYPVELADVQADVAGAALGTALCLAVGRVAAAGSRASAGERT